MTSKAEQRKLITMNFVKEFRAESDAFKNFCMSGLASKTSNIVAAYRMFLNVETKKLKNLKKSNP